MTKYRDLGPSSFPPSWYAGPPDPPEADITDDDLDRLSFDDMIERLADEEEEAARTLRRAGRPATRPDNEWE